MRKKLTSAARCTIKKRSAEININKRQAIEQLRKDLHNGPLHCFGYHKKCSTDYCKAVAATIVTIPEKSETCNDTLDMSESSSQMSVDCLAVVTEEQIMFWNDAMSDSIEESISTTALEEIDQEMVFDVQSIVGRLVAKAEYLIGKKIN